jgi:hypothetical protein
MAYTKYTTREIENAVENEPDHICTSDGYVHNEGEPETCPGCIYEEQVDNEEIGWHPIGYAGPGEVFSLVVAGTAEKLTVIDGESGGEGSGESIWVVFRVGSQYFRKSGYYASYDGSNWDGDVQEVTRRQLTVSTWEVRK